MAPYAFSWTNVAAGSYSITARAYDNLNAVTTSAAVAITVQTAVASAGTLYFIHPDHLDTPRQVSDATGKVVWQWEEQEPFGLIAPLEDPDADAKAFVLNLRFAGQYFDAESRLHYNVRRDYDPATGRYVQADPIGLGGGISLYGYVDGNPLAFVDPLGLAKCNQVGTYSSLTSRTNRGDGLDAHEFLRAANIERQTGAGRGTVEQMNNPSIALTPSTHTQVHQAEALLRQQANIPPGQFGSLNTEMRIMEQALNSAGVPRAAVDALSQSAREYAKAIGLK